jgi:MoxR-like ATPase
MTVRSASQIVPVAQRAALILRELGRIVVGKDDTLKLALACMVARGHL